MDEILYLEPDEEITSVIDKVKKSAAKSVGLVIPRNSSLIHSIVNLKLLKKEAAKKEKDIALITTDKVGKNIASQVGIPVYEDIHAKRPANTFTPDLPKGDEVIEVDMSEGGSEGVEEEPTVKHYGASTGITHNEISFDKPEGKEKSEERQEQKTDDQPSPESPKTVTQPIQLSERSKQPKGLGISMAIFAVIILGTLLGLPQSSIIVTVAAEAFEKTIPLTIDANAKKEDRANQTIPGKLLEVTKSDAERVVATGKKDVGGKAKGQVTLYNGWDSNERRLAAGTVLTASEGKVFSLESDITIPGGTATLEQGQIVTKPGQANGVAVAKEPGESYNIKPTRFTIGGLSSKEQEKIYAESKKDLSGGFTKQVSIMTQTDIDTAKDNLARSLTKEALDDLRKDARELKLIEDAVTSEIINVETNPKAVDTEVEYFDIKVKTKHQVMVFDDKMVNTVVNEALKAAVPRDKELLLGEGDEFVTSVGSTDYAAGKLGLESKIKTKIGTRVDARVTKKGLGGKSERAIREKLSDVPNLKDITVHTFPSWWWQDTSFVPWNTRLRVVYE